MGNIKLRNADNAIHLVTPLIIGTTPGSSKLDCMMGKLYSGGVPSDVPIRDATERCADVKGHNEPAAIPTINRIGLDSVRYHRSLFLPRQILPVLKRSSLKGMELNR